MELRHARGAIAGVRIESPAHDRNMLDSRVTKAGVGEANAYVTFIACR